MNLTLKDSIIARSRAISPWTGLYFLQSLLINLALGYPLSLLYSVAFTCILMLLWRSAPRAQKVLIDALLADCGNVLSVRRGLRLTELQYLAGAALNQYGRVHRNPDHLPRYSYLVGVFIFALGVIAVRRKKMNKSVAGTSSTAFVCCSALSHSLLPRYKTARGGVFKLKDTGYPVFRFAKDVIVNNNEVLDEQERMAKLSSVKDSWTVTAVKPKYHTYVVVIGESARRDALGAFGGHWDNTPFASSVNGYIFADYIAASGSTQKSLGLTLNRVVDNKPVRG